MSAPPHSKPSAPRPPDPSPSRIEPELRHDAWAYALAALILIVGGAMVRTPILNWICGPAIVIASVAFLGPVLDRRASGRSGTRPTPGATPKPKAEK